MAVAPFQQGQQHGAEIPAARGRAVLVAGRLVAVLAALQQPFLDQGREATGEHIGRNAQAFFELVETGEACKRIAQDEHAPPLAHPLEATGYGTGHVIERLALHVFTHPLK